MDDDIDIEEHDVLDNPVIRTIFPDISALKKEITYYFEDESVTIEEAEKETDTLVKTEDSQSKKVLSDKLSIIIDVDNYCPQNEENHSKQGNKIILGSRPIANLQDSNTVNNLHSKLGLLSPNVSRRLFLGSKLDLDTSDTQDDNGGKLLLGSKPNDSSKILLGSKPIYSQHNGKIEMEKKNHDDKNKSKHIKVLLQDIKSYLNQNSRYCKKCCRLFLSKNALEVHKNKIHPSNSRKMYSPKEIGIEKKHKCICGSYFTRRYNLYRHYKTKHGDKIKSSMKSKSESGNKCSICNIRFKTLSGLINHNNYKHQRKGIKNKVQSFGKSTDKENDNNTNKIDIISSPVKKQKPVHAKELNIASTSEENRDNSTALRKRKLAPTKKTSDISPINAISGLINHNNYKHQRKGIKNKVQSFGKSTEKENDNNTNKIDIISSPVKKQKPVHAKELNIASTSEENRDNSTALRKRKLAPTKKTSDISPMNGIIVLDRREHVMTKSKHKANIAKVAHKNDVAVDTNKNQSVTTNQKSKYVTRANSTHKDANLCLHCNKLFTDQKSLIDHMYQILEPKRCSSGSTDKPDLIKAQDDKILFACRHCSYYLLGISAYFTHIIKNHKIEKFMQINKEKFDPQCKYCSYKCSSISTHNNHIYRYHINLMYMKVEDEIAHDKNIQLKKSSDNFYEDAYSEYKEFALESVLFECNKCSTCFLSSDIAMDHDQHKELLINWKCSVCNLILKEQDKVMHLKQHSFSESLKVVTLNESSNVLYICTKCAIHFTENRYQKHYPNCGLEITDSFHCSKCDTLVDKVEKIDHESKHGKPGNTPDFTIIDSNIVMVENDASLNSLETISEKRHQKRTVEQNCLSYCPTCKVFLKDIGLKNKNHVKGTCSQGFKYVCEVCGLVFTHNVLALHKEHHEKEKTLTLQDYKFFDLHGKQVHPPIPEYPHCKRCGIHFLRKIAISSHICDETDFLTCDVCNIKLTEKAYMLHMSFHFYVIQKFPQESKIFAHELNEQTRTATKTSYKCGDKLNERILGKPTGTNPHRIRAQSRDSTKRAEESCTEKNTDEKTTNDSLVVLYTCKACNISFESYDEVIKHCQSHYRNEEKETTSLKKCKQCLLNFDSRFYICHEQRVHLGVSNIKILNFDPRYYISKNTTWIKHLFEPLSEKIVLKLLDKSIYQHEHRIQLECIQRGSSNLFVYQCDKCRHFMDPGNIYKHAHNPCGSVRKHPCTFCGLNFRSWLSRSNHEELHKQDKSLTKKSLNIILFNQKKDQLYNGLVFCTANQYVFFQCRNCSGVSEKSIPTSHTCDTHSLNKCQTCGLLIHPEDLKKHVSKHKKLRNFSSENFKVILFGSNKLKTRTQKLSSSFIGTVYDYSLFKCIKCQMCLRNTEYAEKHTCSTTYDLDRALCPDCDLYFPSSYYKIHEKQHQTDSDFIIKNINVIEFNDGKIVQKNDVEQDLKIENSTIINIDDDDDLDSSCNDANVNPNDENTLYKCKCGLHFVSKLKVTEHVKKCQQKQYKQSCSKCNLLFSTAELFSHLVIHHKDKTQVRSFKVIEMSDDVVR